MNLSTYWAIVPAAGVGSRMQANKPKQYLSLAGKSVLEHSLQSLAEHPKIKKIVVVLDSADIYWQTLSLPFIDKILMATGGSQRYHSVLNGLMALKKLAKADDWVLVHDAVRPCLCRNDLDNLINQLTTHSVGGLLGSMVRDTLKQSDAEGNVLNTVNRAGVWQAYTPQMFRFEKLLQALQQAILNKQAITDEAGAIELMGEKPMLIAGRTDNIKITYPDDLLMAETILTKISAASTNAI